MVPIVRHYESTNIALYLLVGGYTFLQAGRAVPPQRCSAAAHLYFILYCCATRRFFHPPSTNPPSSKRRDFSLHSTQSYPSIYPRRTTLPEPSLAGPFSLFSPFTTHRRTSILSSTATLLSLPYTLYLTDVQASLCTKILKQIQQHHTTTAESTKGNEEVMNNTKLVSQKIFQKLYRRPFKYYYSINTLNTIHHNPQQRKPPPNKRPKPNQATNHCTHPATLCNE